MFCLLPNKNKDTYSAIWEVFCEKFLSLNKPLEPKTLVIDFETSIHLSAKDIIRQQTVSFYAKFGDLFTSAYPNIAIFIKNVLAMQTDSYIQMNSANSYESRTIKTQHKNNIE